MLTLMAGTVFAAWRYRRNELERVRAMRLQIAGELHDDIGANLSAIALKSDLVRRIASDEARSQAALRDIHRLAHDTMQQVREMIWVVRREHDTIEGLLTRMEDSARTLLGGVLNFRFDIDQSVPGGAIDMERRQLAYRMFKEALQNVMKHAHASHVHIRASFDAPDLLLTIVDDGRGFDPDRVRTGTGLKLIKERESKRSVHAVVMSTPGKGSRVVIRVRTR
jgi:signal transduction histidine kinase